MLTLQGPYKATGGLTPLEDQRRHEEYTKERQASDARVILEIREEEERLRRSTKGLQPWVHALVVHAENHHVRKYDRHDDDTEYVVATQSEAKVYQLFPTRTFDHPASLFGSPPGLCVGQGWVQVIFGFTSLGTNRSGV